MWELCSVSESAVPSKKNAANLVEIGLQTATQCVFELCTPRTHGTLDSERDKKTNKKTKQKIKLLCPRGTQTCALAVANIKVDGNGKVILDTHPESDQHQNWTCSRGSSPAPTHQIRWWSMNPFLRYLADKQSAHRQTDRQTDTRRWPQDLAAYGAQVTNTTFSHLQPACVVRSSPNFAWW